MLKSCLPYLGSPNCLDNNDTKSSKEWELGHKNCPNSFSSTLQSKHIFVRVVHAGGKVDHYPNEVLAAKLLENLPAGKWLARPEVFKQPHESIIRPEEYLMPGHKYYVVPLSTLKKLKRKHNKMGGINGMEQVERRMEEEISSDVSAVVEATDYETTGREYMDDSFSSAREFYVRKVKKSTSSTCGNGNGSSGGSRKPGGRILLPHAKPKACSGYTWEPGLTSIQEVSP